MQRVFVTQCRPKHVMQTEATFRPLTEFMTSWICMTSGAQLYSPHTTQVISRSAIEIVVPSVCLSVCLSVCVWRAGAESKYVRTLGMSYRIAVLPVTLWPWVALKVISPILKIARFYVSRKIVHLRWRYRVPIFYDAERVLVCNIKFLVGC